MSVEPDVLFISASEGELNKITQGELAGNYRDWHFQGSRARVTPGETGVLVIAEGSSDKFVRPIALITLPDQQRRLFGRFSTLRTDLSPLSSWSHVFQSALFDRLDQLKRVADLGEYAASWAGLTIAEATLASERRADRLTVTATSATQTFAIARTLALWPSVSLNEVVDRYESANRLLRSGSTTVGRLRPSFEPIWQALQSVTKGEVIANSNGLATRALRVLSDARRNKYEAEYLALATSFDGLPEVRIIEGLGQLTPEDRVSAFDHLVTQCHDATKEPRRLEALSFLAGYLATVAAGGAPSIGLAEGVARNHPEILAWAFVIGGVGERVTWTSSFDGLGRFVARELLRSFRVDEAPFCDFALDEALSLADPHLKDPLVHLRIKQTRVVTVALLPGVNVTVPLGELVEQNRAAASQRGAVRPSDMKFDEQSLEVLANALWPYFQERVGDVKGSVKTKTPKKSGSFQRKLPLEK